MTIPTLNRKLALEDNFRVPDTAGGYTIEWQMLGTLWAEIKPGTGRELARHETSRSRVPLRIVVRASPVGSPARPRAGQRFREDTRIYEIAAVTEADKCGNFLMCFAEEEVVT